MAHQGKKARIDPDHLRKLYYQDNIPSSEIAKIYDVHPQTILNHMRRHGIDRRLPGGQIGELNSYWSGGNTIDKDGYVLVRKPHHPNCRTTGYVLAHRLVMENKIGRFLDPDEVVHHKDKNKQNNHPDNLELYDSNSNHLRDELTGRIPNWSQEGFEKMRLNGINSKPPEWTDEMREKARQRAKERWENGTFRANGRKWDQKERDHMREVAKSRKRLNDKFA